MLSSICWKRDGLYRHIAMFRIYFKQIVAVLALATLILGSMSCRALATTGVFYRNTTPPSQNILRYVTGDEPESLDLQGPTDKPESRIFMGHYEVLVELHPKT